VSPSLHTSNFLCGQARTHLCNASCLRESKSFDALRQCAEEDEEDSETDEDEDENVEGEGEKLPSSKSGTATNPLVSPMSIDTEKSGAGGSGTSRGEAMAAAVSHEPHPVPYNPFLHTGALVVASLVGRGHAKKTNRLFHDSGSRFTHLHERVKDMAGGLPIGFNKPLFLALKQRGRKVCVRVCVGVCVCRMSWHDGPSCAPSGCCYVMFCRGDVWL
jgi:hypothetical protein